MRAWALLLAACALSAAAAEDAIDKPLAPKGDASRGRAIVVNRQAGLCLLCHSGPFPGERLMGDIAPSLQGVGARLTEGQLRLRIVDSSKVSPQTIMPPYYRTAGFTHVAPAFKDKPILDAQQVEDVVAFLVTLR